MERNKPYANVPGVKYPPNNAPEWIVEELPTRTRTPGGPYAKCECGHPRRRHLNDSECLCRIREGVSKPCRCKKFRPECPGA